MPDGSKRRHGRGNVGRPDPEREPLHAALQCVRELHCEHRDEPGHVCIGRMTVHREGVDLDCTRCGSLDLRDDDQLAVDAMVRSFDAIAQNPLTHETAS